MSITILKDSESVNNKRFLCDIESDIKRLLATNNRNKQPLFNELIKELSNLKKPNSDLSVFSGLNVAYFFNLYYEAIDGKNLKGFRFDSVSRKIRTFIKDCPYLKPQFNGIEITFKPQETEIRKIKTRVLRF